MEEQTYNVYSQYLKSKYGEKVYKLPVNLPTTCPNRDGHLGEGGCYFCSDKGAGFESLPSTDTVIEQLEKNKAYIGKRYKAKKFIAYFQNYTNTYMAYDQFEAYMKTACVNDVVELDIATRPDCVDKGHLDILKKVSKEYGVNVVVELGLQTTNDQTLVKINRGHTVQQYIDAVKLIHQYGFGVCTHLILNLPWDNDQEVINMAQLLNELKVEMVKCHSLYIAKGTKFASLYDQGELKLNTLENYVDRAVMFLAHLNPECTVQRLLGRAPKEDTVFCNWNTSWWKIQDKIIEKMLKDKLVQGKMMRV